MYTGDHTIRHVECGEVCEVVDSADASVKFEVHCVDCGPIDEWSSEVYADVDDVENLAADVYHGHATILDTSITAIREYHDD